jgi:iron(III) transport system ATP-binding protein
VPTESASALRCIGLRVHYDKQAALHGIDLQVERGELVAVLGPSGAGKSTLLAAVAGLVAPAGGEIWLSGQRVADARRSVPAENRDVAMVFQNYALWPHLTALDTAAYPLRRSGVGRRGARERAHRLLEQLGVSELAARRPAELSGGEQQRVGLARALARDAALYLLDEPTAHLDTTLRDAFQAEVASRRLTVGAAALVATHDPAEALAVADRVALLVGGRIVQVGTPAEVYERPASVTAARLTGPVSALRGRVASCVADRLSVDLGRGAVTVSGGGIDDGDAGPATVLARPEWTVAGGPFRGTVIAALFRGGYTDSVIRTSAGEVLLREPGPPQHQAGEEIAWGLRRAWAVPRGSSTHDDQPSAAIAP